MKERLRPLLTAALAGVLLKPEYTDPDLLDEILDARDGDSEFEGQWLKLAQEVEAAWKKADVSPADRAFCEDLRRESFLCVSRATEQHEAASYVSDDLDLVARGIHAEVQNAFLEELLACYERHEMPKPTS